MRDLLLLATLIVVPGLLGLAPALLRRRLPPQIPRALLVATLAVSLWLTWITFRDPHPFLLGMLIPFWAGWIFAAGLLIAARRAAVARTTP